ncbi:MAG: 4-(cytidine 5'-diphospho)-2-C-methyl-D-erythritol kinase [Sphingomonadales bacterium]
MQQTGPLAARGVRCRAPAKLNLYLHVTGRRDDGYHELDSLFVFVDVCDDIAVRPAAAFSLEVDGPFADQIPAGADNLVLRAARLLAEFAHGSFVHDSFVHGRKALGRPGGAAITLTKILPPASGIGGGSADAAATLRALRMLWGLQVTQDELAGIAGRLGADVPACLASRALQVSGIGDVMEPVNAAPDVFFLLVNPGTPLSTPAVFEAYRDRNGAFSRRAPIYGPAGQLRDNGARARDLTDALSSRHNDLEQPALDLAPEVGLAMAVLRTLDGCLLARMSGSGATCFAMFETMAAAATGAAILGERFPSWWIAPARPVPGPFQPCPWQA